MEGRLGKILKELNIGLQSARAMLGRNITLNSKITEGQYRILFNYIRNLSNHKETTTKPKSPPTEYTQGVPEEVYSRSVQNNKRKKVKKKNSIPIGSTSKKGSAKYSDSYSLQQLKSNLAKKFAGYIYGLSDW